MKKILCIFLSLVLVMGLAACTKAEDKKEAGKTVKFKEGKLYAGFGRADISPDNPVPLGGYGQSQDRMHTSVMDPLMASCIAFTDGDDTFLLLSVDAVRSHQAWTDAVREKLQKDTGIPGENIMIVSTHTHSAPDTTSNMNVILKEYTEIYVNGCVKAAKAALDDRSEVTMYTGSAMTENLTFVRHYRMNDGTVSGPNFGNWSSGIAGYVTENDPEMILVKLDRVDEKKKDILMMNFQAHTTLTGGSDKTQVSADYVGVCRTTLEAQTGMHFAFFLGACGNQTPDSYIATDNNKMPYAEKLSDSDRTYVTYGNALAYYALDILPTMTEVEGAGIETTSEVVTCNTNKGGVDRIIDAQRVVDEWEANGRDAGNSMAAQLGFHSVYECSGILGRLDRPATYDVEVFATRIGGLNFVNVPYEMFASNSHYIKDNSPADLTMVFTQSNHAWGYITDKQAFEYPCYENFGGTFAEGSGELLAETMVGLLGEIQP